MARARKPAPLSYSALLPFLTGWVFIVGIVAFVFHSMMGFA